MFECVCVFLYVKISLTAGPMYFYTDRRVGRDLCIGKNVLWKTLDTFFSKKVMLPKILARLCYTFNIGRNNQFFCKCTNSVQYMEGRGIIQDLS